MSQFFNSTEWRQKTRKQKSLNGTFVASKVAFSHIGLQLTDAYLKPRARVIDCDIYGADTEVSQEDMAARIEEAVEEFHDVAKIFNLSSNVNKCSPKMDKEV